MRRYTDADFILTISNINLENANLYVTITQSDTELTIPNESLTKTYNEPDTVVIFSLSQKDSARFSSGRRCEIQVNWFENGIRCATNIKTINISENLLGEVITE